MQKNAVIYCIICVVLINSSWAQNQFFQPQPFGGEKSWEKWIRQEMYFPPEEYKKNESAKVIFEFEVLHTGAVSKAKILNEVSKNFRDEAWRLFNMTLWHPGVYDGEKCNATRVITIDFNRYKYDKWVRDRGYRKPPNYESNRPLKIYTQEEVDSLPVPRISIPLSLHLKREVQYPREAVKHGIEGEAAVAFIVEPSGVISNLFIAKNLGGGCVQEIEREIKQLVWEPALKNDSPVRTFMIVQMSFSLKGNSEFRYLPAQQYGSYF